MGDQGFPISWLYSAADGRPEEENLQVARDKRRATHRIEAPRLNTCPQCGQPKQPHRMCPTCKTYAGREIEPLRTPAP